MLRSNHILRVTIVLWIIADSFDTSLPLFVFSILLYIPRYITCRFTLYSFQGAIRILGFSTADFLLYSAYSLESTGIFWFFKQRKKILCQKTLVGSNGIEPSTSRLSGVRSNHLSYEPILSDYGRFHADVQDLAILIRSPQICFHKSLEYLWYFILPIKSTGT